MTCLCCQTDYHARSGRGLCRRCWNNPKIREKYPIKAEFGGQAASAIGWEQSLVRRAIDERAVKAGEWVI